MLVGVGLDNWAFKVSMYDVSSPASPKEVETLMAPNCSWSEANWDHKAVQFDPQRSWMFVPYNAYDQASYDCDQVVWIIATGEGGLTTMAELEVGSGACFVRCVLIEGMLFVVTDSQVTSYDMDGFMEVGMIEHGGLEIIRDEDNTMEQFIER
jgi:uncharacterized secreted protein with C-terminal beta-propeller domain